MNDLSIRIFSAIVLLAISLPFIWYGSVGFQFLTTALALIILFEWFGLMRGRPFNIFWSLCGLCYASIPFLLFPLIRNTPDSVIGFWIFSFLLYVVVLTDIGAYVCGRAIGGAKLWESVSPNKTWSGAIGGFIIGVLSGIEFYLYIIFFEIHLPFTFWHFLLGSMIISLFCQFGDLYESWVKRCFDAKDSGWIILGHGGFMDRFDGLLFASLPVSMYLTSG